MYFFSHKREMKEIENNAYVTSSSCHDDKYNKQEDLDNFTRETKLGGNTIRKREEKPFERYVCTMNNK